ncbi:enoyl-CoA hydratase [Sphingomonas naasensis]|uniref:Enoyl-CoA hydratase/isomerase family protein n=1 Tax=Sphingomonas naasensis TaxID=1344951 RepID=A0A4S1WWB2_9SPHN|nr:enoyl-CoA hydratase/isomerase family protein [Sphingomonas naasensis]NIJ18598.1 enoyl-CoA hydratase [Sphingomonas naasensis]TGX45846.1 enoyl-CoA hydratase/isomerase family protein [Sphingomonas naasensis]
MIQLTRDGPVATIALARPEARNALPIAAWQALAAAARGVGDARAVVVKSDVPGIFSAGADVREFAALQADPALRPVFRTTMRDAIDAIAALPMPVIAAIDGGCFGAAVALILAADIRIAGNHAEFATTPARLGLGYPQEDVARLVAQVGQGMASLLLFTGDRIVPDEAKRIGLVELRSKKAGETAAGLASAIAGNAPDAVRLLKRTIRGGAGLDQAFDDAFGGAEFAEGVAAFRERRKPLYR